MPLHRGYVIQDREQTPVAEAFRSLRAKLQAAQSENGLKALLFASASAGFGNAVTAANAAATLAYAGKRVILIEGDFRTPCMHELFSLSNSGITNMLHNDKALEQMLQSTTIPNLKVLTSGELPETSSEVLFHPRIRHIIEEAKSLADFVLITSSPLIVEANRIISDACVLASKVDGVVLIVEARTVHMHRLTKVMSLLQGAQANIIGSVLENVTDERDFIF